MLNSSGVSGGKLAGVRVLVVDDEEDSRLFLRMVLEDEDAEVHTATGGREGLAMAEAESYDIMTLDLSMPDFNGIDVFTALRNSSSLATLPVCIVSGHAELRALIYERTVRPPEGFLNKPVDAEPLVDTLRRILDLSARS